MSDATAHHALLASNPTRGRSVYVDTSSAAGIQPHLLEYAVEKIGAEKILFGTVRVFASASHPAFVNLAKKSRGEPQDTPLYFTAMQRARIDSADLPDEAKQLILRGNAERLLARRGKPK